MHQGKFVFSQILDQVVRYQFNQCVTRYKGEYRVKNFSCWEQFLALVFGQLSFRESLRDIVVCLGAHREKLYHLGFGSPIILTTLSRSNERRDWRIWRDYAQLLIGEARKLYANDQPTTLDLDGTAYVIDSTTIELCLSIFPWARLVKRRAAIKLHLELALGGNIPSFFDFSSGKEPDVFFLDRIVFEPRAYYIMDRGYIDFARLYAIHRAGAFFVTRAKDNLSFRRLYSHLVDAVQGVRCDQIVVLKGYQARKDYPEKLRRIKYYDAETHQRYVFLTNNFDLDAKTIADLYKHRWQIELFFKWIKQHLRVTVFWGRSENAVKTQICIALCAYLLVAILKKQLGIKRNSYEILQILSVSLFDKTSVFTLISEFVLPTTDTDSLKQASLWDY
jgi:hypothetical protein